MFETGEEFVETFRTVAGYFGANDGAVDLPELEEYGSMATSVDAEPNSKQMNIAESEHVILSTMERKGHENR